MKLFECTMCGICCTHMYEVTEILLPHLAKIIGKDNAYFPYSHNNGICEKLSEDNHCLVYENRPTICNVEKIINIVAKKHGDNFEEVKKSMYESQRKMCQQLQAEKYLK